MIDALLASLSYFVRRYVPLFPAIKVHRCRPECQHEAYHALISRNHTGYVMAADTALSKNATKTEKRKPGSL